MRKQGVPLPVAAGTRWPSCMHARLAWAGGGLCLCALQRQRPALLCIRALLGAGGGDVGWTLGAALAEGYRLAGMGRVAGGMVFRYGPRGC